MVQKCCPTELELWPTIVGEACPAEVARHLRRCDPCRRRIQFAREQIADVRGIAGSGSGVPPAITRRHTVDRGGSQSPEIPSRLGNYEVLGILGEGGQAVVYRAWHPRLQTEIAVKRLRARNEESAPSDLAYEAVVLAGLHSPALPQALDLEICDGETLLILELIHGEPLTKLTAPLPPSRLLKVIRQLSAAIDDLHGNDLLHLDLSPGNVLIDETGNCRLIDFGLARRFSEPRPEGIAGLVGGTPGFAAPEIWELPQHVDRRTDVYGIGAVLHYLLTGAPPMVRCDRPADVGPRWAVGSDAVSTRLWAICQRAIARHPQQRWQRVDEIITALNDVENGRSHARRWMGFLAIAASLLVGSGHGPHETANADVFIHQQGNMWRLEDSAPVRLGDEIAFAFDWPGDAAGLAIRTPAGRTLPLKPFARSAKEGSGPFRFPPSGGAVLRKESGTYVVYFWPDDGKPGGLEQCVKRLSVLPPPPKLVTGERLSASCVRDGAGDVVAAARKEEAATWRRQLAMHRTARPGLTAVAIHVE